MGKVGTEGNDKINARPKVHKIMKMLLYSKIARMNKRNIVVHNASLKVEVSTNTDLNRKNELLKLILKYKEQ